MLDVWGKTRPEQKFAAQWIFSRVHGKWRKLILAIDIIYLLMMIQALSEDFGDLGNLGNILVALLILIGGELYLAHYGVQYIRYAYKKNQGMFDTRELNRYDVNEQVSDYIRFGSGYVNNQKAVRDTSTVLVAISGFFLYLLSSVVHFPSYMKYRSELKKEAALPVDQSKLKNAIERIHTWARNDDNSRPFSRKEVLNILVEQEGIDEKTACAALEQCGVDWNAMAVRMAESYKRNPDGQNPANTRTLMEALGYTKSEIKHAIETVYR